MPADLMTHKFEAGFTLVELLVGVAIISIGASSAIPSLYKQFQQSSVDSYTQKLESGLNQIKANMISRQSSCVIRFPLQASQEPGVAPSQLDNLIVNEEVKVDEEAESQTSLQVARYIHSLCFFLCSVLRTVFAQEKWSRSGGPGG